MNKNSQRLLAQLKQRFTSEVLWHFVSRNKDDTRSYNVLLSILQSGLKVGEKNKEFKFLDVKTNQWVTLWGYPVSCLADIPLKDLHIHAERYGRFAIGFHKESVINNHFNPVLYINQYSSLFHRFIERRNEIEAYLDRVDKSMSDKFEELLLLLGAIAKAGDLKANPVNDAQRDELQANNFYYEREWCGVSAWDFKKEDVAAVILPDEYIAKFLADKSPRNLKVDDTTVVLPFSMVYRL